MLIEARDRAGDTGAASRDRREYAAILEGLGVGALHRPPWATPGTPDPAPPTAAGSRPAHSSRCRTFRSLSGPFVAGRALVHRPVRSAARWRSCARWSAQRPATRETSVRGAGADPSPFLKNSISEMATGASAGPFVVGTVTSPCRRRRLQLEELLVVDVLERHGLRRAVGERELQGRGSAHVRRSRRPPIPE